MQIWPNKNCINKCWQSKIRENDFNLNIPRYVDTFEEEEPVNLDEINKQLEQDNKEIAELEAEINEQLKILGVK